MFSNILIATDLSRDSDELIRCVAGMSAVGCRETHLVYGVEMDDIGGLRSSIEQLVGVEIEKQKAVLQRAGIKAVGHVAMRPADKEITRIAEEHACTLLVAGSRVHSLAGEIVAGGVAGSLLTSHRQPLLMMRLHHTEEADPATCCSWPCSPLEHLLHPTDFSDNAEHALAYVQKLIQRIAPKRITLMHVQDQRRIDRHLEDRLEEYNTIDQQRLERQRQTFAAITQADVDIELPYGHPSQIITDFCRQEAVSLVVMGTQGRGALAEAFLGSVSHYVARHSPVPTLLIPKP